MKKNLFKKLLSVALAATLLFTSGGMGANTSVAKSSIPTEKKVTGLSFEYQLYDMDTDKYVMQVEAGNKFYFGDVVSAGIKYSNGLEYNRYLTGLNATYKSSKTSVAAIDKKTGMVTPKKKGTTKLTVTYKKQKATLTLKVVAKNSFERTSSDVKKLNKKLASYSKSFKGVFNEKNAAKMIKAAKKCKNLVDPFNVTDSSDPSEIYSEGERYMATYGFGVVEETYEDGNTYATQTNELIYPGIAHYHAMDQTIYSEIYIKYNPFVRTSANPVTIKKATATAGDSKAVLTLSRKITALEYTMLSYAGDYLANDKPYVYFYVVNSDMPDYMVWTDGAVKKNSNKITVTMGTAYDKDGNYYSADYSTTTADKEIAKKLSTFRSGVSYTFYKDASFAEDGTFSYANKKNSWTNNYTLTME